MKKFFCTALVFLWIFGFGVASTCDHGDGGGDGSADDDATGDDAADDDAADDDAVNDDAVNDDVADDDAVDDDLTDDDTVDDDTVDDDSDDDDTSSMVLIPEDDFWMGCEPEDLQCLPADQPRHQVWVSSFWLDYFEVTNEEYAAYLNSENPDNDCGTDYCVYDTHHDHCSGLYQSDTDGTWLVDESYETRSVIDVSWYGAQAYCAARSKRLPTEAEWEKAAKGALEHYRYPWGDTWFPNVANWALNGDPYESGPLPTTVPPWYFNGTNHGGTYQTMDGRSPYGVFEMAGNAWEWVNDWYQPDYYALEPPEGWADPQGPEDGTLKVLRGGAWLMTDPYYLVTTLRWTDRPDYGCWAYGFRCAHDQ